MSISDPEQRDEESNSVNGEMFVNSTSSVPGSVFMRYFHLVLFSAFYACVLFFATILIRPSLDVLDIAILAVTIFSSIVATAMLVAIWSAFGQQSYLVRFGWSHLIGIIVALALLAGLIASTEFQFAQGRDWFADVLFFLAAIPSISIAAQIPFLCLRVCFGWQFVFRQEQVSRSFDLRDVFAFVFVLALSLSAPQVAINMSRPAADSHEYVLEGVEADEAEFDEAAMVASRQSYRNRVLMGYATTAILVFLVALASTPLLLFVFRIDNLPKGIGLSVFYTFGLTSLTVVPIALVDPPEGVAATTAFLICATSLTILLPLAVSRWVGFRLASPGREAKDSRKDGTHPKSATAQAAQETDSVHPLD